MGTVPPGGRFRLCVKTKHRGKNMAMGRLSCKIKCSFWEETKKSMPTVLIYGSVSVSKPNIQVKTVATGRLSCKKKEEKNAANGEKGKKDLVCFCMPSQP